MERNESFYRNGYFDFGVELEIHVICLFNTKVWIGTSHSGARVQWVVKTKFALTLRGPQHGYEWFGLWRGSHDKYEITISKITNDIQYH